MDKKKIWTVAAITMAGISAYSIFHTHKLEQSCIFCNHAQAIGFTTGVFVWFAIYSYQNN